MKFIICKYSCLPCVAFYGVLMDFFAVICLNEVAMISILWTISDLGSGIMLSVQTG